jgi:hypothetical protein
MASEADATKLVAKGDVAAIRDLWDSAPKLRDHVLKEIKELDENVTTTADTVLAFRREIIADAAYWRIEKVARMAALSDDEASFQAGTSALGEHASGLEHFAHGLIQKGDHARAVRVLRAVVASPTASLTSWNNLAYALLFASLPLDESRPLLAAAEKRGAQNPNIFHNTACVWVKLGASQEALGAVENAVRCGYTLLDRMRADDDLAPLRSDPRFDAAFAAKTRVGFDELVTTILHKGTNRVVARPVVKMDFFLESLEPPLVCEGLSVLLDTRFTYSPEEATTSRPGGAATRSPRWPKTDSSRTRRTPFGSGTLALRRGPDG